ncbi:MAG: rhomboid family intramembrane serine protease [Verrucomicrobiota bacterium]
MGSHERDYNRGQGGRVGPPPITPVVKWLLILNIGIFVIDMIVPNRAVADWGSFSVSAALGSFEIWKFVTFQFIHESVLHILFNSIGIYFVGPFVERWWGSRRFLRFYLLCGVAGALFYMLLASLGLMPGPDPLQRSLVGASAGLFGLLIAVYVIAPDVRIRLLIPPIELTMRTLVKVLIIFSVVVIVGAMIFPGFGLFGNSGGEAGHLGGAIMGFVLMKFPWLLNWRMPSRKVIRPREFRRKQEPKIRPRTVVDLNEADEVDRILDKIAKDGPESLTPEELEVLKKAGEKKS